MQKFAIVGLSVLALVLAAAYGRAGDGTGAQVGRYQVVNGKYEYRVKGKVFDTTAFMKIDTATGEAWIYVESDTTGMGWQVISGG